MSSTCRSIRGCFSRIRTARTKVLPSWCGGRSIAPPGRLTETIIDDRGDEFPRINGRYGGQPYRYVYSARWGNDVAFGPAMKHDMQRQSTEVHDYGPGKMTAAPVFVRKRGATAEDEGWIMSYV
jgi:carotenoid cleavage dioxygenase-like enzyme